MNISMWMLAEHLPQYSPDPHITGGTMCIRSASMLFSGESVSTHTVYVSRSDDFIPTLRGRIICSNRNDYIILNSDDVEEVFEAIVRLIDEYTEWDLHVKEMMDERCTLEDVMLADAPVLKHLLFIVNPGFLYTALAGTEYLSDSYAYRNVLTIGDGMPADHVHEYVSFLGRHRNERHPFFFKDPLESSAGLIQVLYYGDSIQGYFMMFFENTCNYTHTERQLFDICAEHLIRWYQLNPPEHPGNEYSDLAVRLLNRNAFPLTETDRRIWQRIGWNDDDIKLVADIQMNGIKYSDRDAARSEVMLSRIRHYTDTLFPFGMFIPSADRTIPEEYHLLLNMTHAESLPGWDNIVRLVREEQIPFGLSYRFTSMEQIPDALEQARIAAQYAGAERGTPLDCQTCALEYMDHFLRSRLPVDLSHPLVARLREYDHTHHSNLEETARVWLLKERSLVRTAAAMNIHVNTLKYRLNQLRELGLSADINDSERLHLLLSLLSRQNTALPIFNPPTE